MKTTFSGHINPLVLGRYMSILSLWYKIGCLCNKVPLLTRKVEGRK